MRLSWQSASPTQITRFARQLAVRAIANVAIAAL